MKQWFYAADGQQQGPFSELEIQNLLLSRTITPSTLVWSAGMAEWTPLAQAPGLEPMSQIVTGAIISATAPPPPQFAPAEEFTAGSVIGEGWSVFKTNWLNILIVGLSLFGINFLIAIAQVIITWGAGAGFGQLFNLITMIFVSPCLMIGYWTVLLQIVDGEEFSIGAIFSRFDQWWMAALTYVVSIIIIIIGFIFLIIPGIIASLLLFFWMAICADEGKGCDHLASLKKSYELVKTTLAADVRPDNCVYRHFNNRFFTSHRGNHPCSSLDSRLHRGRLSQTGSQKYFSPHFIQLKPGEIIIYETMVLRTQ